MPKGKGLNVFSDLGRQLEQRFQRRCLGSQPEQCSWQLEHQRGLLLGLLSSQVDMTRVDKREAFFLPAMAKWLWLRLSGSYGEGQPQ